MKKINITPLFAKTADFKNGMPARAFIRHLEGEIEKANLKAPKIQTVDGIFGNRVYLVGETK